MKTDKVDMREKTNDCKELYTLHFSGFEKCRVWSSWVSHKRNQNCSGAFSADCEGISDFNMIVNRL